MQISSRQSSRALVKTTALAALCAVLGAASACQSGGAGDSTSTASSAGSSLSATSGHAAPTKSDVASKGAAKPSASSKPAALPAPPDVAAPGEKAQTTASGLASEVITAGTGSEHPGPKDTVKVHYTGWTKDGKMFDSSIPRGQPTQFPLNRVIKGWTEGLQLMVTGEKRRFWIPGNLAYGEKPRRPGAPSGQLTFDVELLEIQKYVPPPPPPEAPKDVAAPPSDAKKTASGLRYKVLKAGTGTAKPAPTNRVKVHYSGWTTDGKLFDSSIPRGRPSSFGVTAVIKGWVEGLQLMVVGEKTRFWIPAELAYGEKPAGGRPAGQLVFDVELLEIL